MVALVCLDFLPLYFLLDTEGSIGYGMNELRWALPYVFRQLFTSAQLAILKKIKLTVAHFALMH